MTRLFNAGDTEPRVQESPRARMEWLVDDELVEGAGVSVARMTLQKGALSEAHRHPNCNEVIHLVEGRIEQRVDEERFVMAPGDSCFVPRGSLHRSRNLGPGEAVMIVSYSEGRRIYEPAEDDRPGR